MAALWRAGDPAGRTGRSAIKPLDPALPSQ
jgi:hypothetical protein